MVMAIPTEKVRKELPESMVFADDVVMCGANEVDLKEYLESWRKALHEMGMRVSRPKPQKHSGWNTGLKQEEKVDRQTVEISGE